MIAQNSIISLIYVSDSNCSLVNLTYDINGSFNFPLIQSIKGNVEAEYFKVVLTNGADINSQFYIFNCKQSNFSLKNSAFK